MFRTFVFCFMVCATGVAMAQPPQSLPDPFSPAPEPAEESQNNEERRRYVYPAIRLIYYAGYEGTRWQEVAYLDLEDWSPDKDVIITADWIPRSGLRSPGANSPRHIRDRDPFKDRYARVPVRRAWSVQYVEAVNEGESHIFVDADGLPRFSQRIYRADDVFSYLHNPHSGWHELGKAAREFRNWQSRRPRNQQPDSQNPFDTRSR